MPLVLYCSFDECQTEVFKTDVIQSIYFHINLYILLHGFWKLLSIISAFTVVTGRVFDTEYDSVSFLCWKDSTIAMKFSLFITYTEGRKTFKMLKFKNKNHEQPVCIPFVIT